MQQNSRTNYQEAISAASSVTSTTPSDNEYERNLVIVFSDGRSSELGFDEYCLQRFNYLKIEFSTSYESDRSRNAVYLSSMLPYVRSFQK